MWIFTQIHFLHRQLFFINVLSRTSHPILSKTFHKWPSNLDPSNLQTFWELPRSPASPWLPCKFPSVSSHLSAPISKATSHILHRHHIVTLDLSPHICLDWSFVHSFVYCILQACSYINFFCTLFCYIFSSSVSLKLFFATLLFWQY